MLRISIIILGTRSYNLRSELLRWIGETEFQFLGIVEKWNNSGPQNIQSFGHSSSQSSVRLHRALLSEILWAHVDHSVLLQANFIAATLSIEAIDVASLAVVLLLFLGGGKKKTQTTQPFGWIK